MLQLVVEAGREPDHRMMVRVAGIEPALLAEPDFESGASTNSTTPASSRLAPT